MRVVNNQQIRTTTRQITPNTNSVIHPTTARVPPTTRLRIRRQLHIRENLPVLVTLNQILRLATKIYRQLRRVRRLNDLLLRITAHEPRRKQKRRKLRLRVPRRHVDNNTLQLTTRNTLQLLRNHLVMPTRNKIRPNPPNKS